MRFNFALERIRIKKIAHVLIFLFLVALGFASTFHFACRGALPSFIPLDTKVSLPRETDDIEGYARTEESTYLTYPEWWTVFSSQEYGSFLMAGERPSRFPFFRSIAQFWSGYCRVYGITTRHYPFNAGNHLMLSVIGVSTSVEYAIKGIYENTVGRVTEWSSPQMNIPEDRFAAAVAKEYGAFIPNYPWYEFPFGERFVQLWTSTPFIDRHPLRKLERKIFLSVEYGVKSLYAFVIRLGTRAVYGAPDETDYAIAINLTPETARDFPKLRVIKELPDSSKIVALPHYQGFTDLVPALARAGVDFNNISGNDEILVSVRAPRSWVYPLNLGQELFRAPIYTERDMTRVLIQSPTRSLGETIVRLEQSGASVEHLYDY